MAVEVWQIYKKNAWYGYSNTAISFIGEFKGKIILH